jgi:hypothetical protein
MKPPNDQAEAERRKAAALTLVETHRDVFVRRGRRALLQAMLAGAGKATADDVRQALELPAGMDPRCLGAVPGRLAYDRVITPAGFVRSARPESHGRWVEVWHLADREAAEVWLRDHPDLPDPGDDGGQDLETRQGVLFGPQETEAPTGATAGAGD